MGMISRIFSVAVGLAAGAAALKLLKSQQQKGVFELSEKDYVEIPLSHSDTGFEPQSTHQTEEPPK